MLLTQFGANFISQLIASVADITRARVATENIMNVITENAVDMNNLSDEGFRPVMFFDFFINYIFYIICLIKIICFILESYWQDSFKKY